MSHREVAEIFGAKRAVVSKWMRRWRDGGWRGWRGRRGRRPGEQQALLPWRQGEISRHSWKQSRSAAAAGILVDVDAVLELIDQRFGIRLAVTTVEPYLRAWGFTPQVPAHQALERDPEAVKQWLAVRYPKIREKATRGGGILLWQDETGFRSQCSHGRSWSPKVQTPDQAGHRPAVRREHDLGNRERRVAALRCLRASSTSSCSSSSSSG